MPAKSRVLGERYELRRRLGGGPIGEVWEGHDLVLGRPVAVKVAHARLAADEAFRTRLPALARDAARVLHPNAVAVHDLDEDGRFVVTELVQGHSVRRLLGDRGTLDVDLAVRVATGACSALSAAHAAGVLHRGLKPENLLVTADGGVKVTDFALSAAAPGPGLADARYLAPEELETGRVDDRSDLYALGCCLYEMLTGQPPFDGPTPFAIAAGHLSERPRRPRSLRADLPEELEAVVATTLSKDPGDRYQTPTELRRALQRAVAGPRPPVGATAEPAVAIASGPGAPAAGPPATPTPAPAPAADGSPTPVEEGGRNRPRATLVDAGLVAGLVAVVMVAATLVSREWGAPAGAGSTTVRPASAVSAATSPARLVPAVAGATQAAATERLHHAGIPVGSVRRVRSGRIPRGHVVATRPPAGTALQPGQRVDLVLSNGNGPASVADLVALIDANPRAAGPRAPRFRGRLTGLDDLRGRRRQAELADLLGIARAGATNGDFSRRFSAALVRVLGPKVGVDELIALVDLLPEAAGPRGPRFRGRLAHLETLHGARHRAELVDLLGIARAGATNGDFTTKFSAATVLVLSSLA
jgi:eukaryotic-like serine/threonine-protein kinase